MRLLLFILSLSLVACAKQQETDADASPCGTYSSAYMITYPDGIDRKSDVEYCNSVYKATALDGSGETVSGSSLTVRLTDVNANTLAVTYYHTTFNGQ